MADHDTQAAAAAEAKEAAMAAASAETASGKLLGNMHSRSHWQAYAKLQTGCQPHCHVALPQLSDHTLFDKHMHNADVLCLSSLLDVCANAKN